MTKKFLILFGIAVLFYSCSSTNTTRTVVLGKLDSLRHTQKSKEAMDYFVQGAIADAKGDYATAILEYQDALKLDSRAGIYYVLGKDYLQLNKLPLALVNAKQAARLDSTNSEYFSLLAEIYTNAHQSDSAALAFEKIISLDSGNVTAYYNLGLLYEHTKPLQALAVYQKLSDNIGPEWNVLARIAELQERLGNTDESIKTLEQLRALDPSNLELEKLLIDTYTKAKRFDEALNELQSVLTKYPGDAALHEMKGHVFLQRNDWKNASKEFAYILDNPKVSIDTKVKIGSVFLAQAMQDSTVIPVTKNIFQKLDKDTTSWQIKMILGEIALQEKDDSAAVRNFRLVTALAKWNVDAWVRLGGMYYDTKRYSEAVTLLGEAVQSFPDNFPVNLILGLSLTQTNDFEKARVYLKKAVDLNPKDVTALSALGYALNQDKQPEDAVHYIKEALKMSPGNADLLGTLGMIYNSQKKWNECDSAYSEAIKIDSANVLLLNNYAYSLAERGIRLDDALKMAGTAVSKEPANSSYLDTFGWVYFKLGDFNKAEEYVRKAIALDSNNSTLLEHLGDIIFREGNRTVAMEMWQKAYQLNSDNPGLRSKIEKGEL